MPVLSAIPFKIQRLPFTAAAGLLPVVAPITCTAVSIINLTTGDAEIHSDDSGTAFGILAPGHERVFLLPQSGPNLTQFRNGTYAFFLKVTVDGTMLVIWS